MLKSLLDTPYNEVRRLTHEEMRHFIVALHWDAFTGDKPLDLTAYFRDAHGLSTPEEVDNFPLSFPLRLLHDRLQSLSTKQVSAWLAEFLMMLTQGHPGTLVMYAYALHRSSFEGVLSMRDFVEMFPQGYPTPDALDKAWRAQKSTVKGQDNLLDLSTTWK